MALRNKFCPRCMNIIRKNDTVCSKCGMKVKDMYKDEIKPKKTSTEISDMISEINALNDKRKESDQEKNIKADKNEAVVSLEENKTQPETEESVAIDDKDKQKKLSEEERNQIIAQKISDQMEQNEGFISSDSVVEELVSDGSINSEMVGKVYFDEDKNTKTRKRHKHKPKRKEDLPEFTVDEDGSYNIDTKDVTFLEGIEKPTQSVRKARGDMPKQEKLKWWEIYKWADRMLAKRKISKEVKKASKKIPTGITKTSMLLWCVFFGWLGIHNFYAKNNKKGWTIVVSDIIILIVMSIEALYSIMGVFVGGGLGFLVLTLWVYDLISIIFNKYSYRISKEEFISNLNVDTRLKLGKKYVAMDKAYFKEKEKARLEKKYKKQKTRKIKDKSGK